MEMSIAMFDILLLALATIPFILLLVVFSLPEPKQPDEEWLSFKKSVFWPSSLSRPLPRLPSPSWPLAVVQLARAFVAGEDCAFALHDALVEGGFEEAASSFRFSGYSRQCRQVQSILEK
jgi:hypothetical protein